MACKTKNPLGADYWLRSSGTAPKVLIVKRLLICLTTALLGLGLSQGKRLPLSGQTFEIGGRTAFLMMPREALPAGEQRPWVWYAPTLPGLPGNEEKWMLSRFIENGIAIAGIDVGESFGNPEGRRLYTVLYQTLTENHGLSRRPCLLGRSRGGLMLYNWATENPAKVSCIAGIYPVCNLASWPGLARSCKAYGLTRQALAASLKDHNPIERLAPLAKAKIPIFHIHGDIDTVVPLEANSGILSKRYAKLGGSMTLKVIRNQGHNMWSGWFRDEDLVAFILENTTKPKP